MERAGLQDTRHPVGFVVFLGNALDGVVTGLVPGQHDVEHVAVDACNHRGYLGARRYPARETVCQRLQGLRGAGLYDLDDFLVFDQLYRAAQDIGVGLVRVAFFEYVVPGLDPGSGNFLD